MRTVFMPRARGVTLEPGEDNGPVAEFMSNRARFSFVRASGRSVRPGRNTLVTFQNSASYASFKDVEDGFRAAAVTVAEQVLRSRMRALTRGKGRRR